MRNSARKQLANHSVKSRLKTLQRSFLSIAATGKKDDATAAYRAMTSPARPLCRKLYRS